MAQTANVTGEHVAADLDHDHCGQQDGDSGLQHERVLDLLVSEPGGWLPPQRRLAALDQCRPSARIPTVHNVSRRLAGVYPDHSAATESVISCNRSATSSKLKLGVDHAR